MTSLREYDRVEDRIRQQRQVEKGPILIVEGPDDLSVLKSHLNSKNIFPASGKENVLKAMRTLEEWGTKGVRGLVDSDFDGDPEDPCIITYLGRDLEGMIIKIGGLAHLLEHIGSRAKIEQEGGSSAIVDNLVERAMDIALLRFHSRNNQWGLSFDKVDLKSKIDKATLDINRNNYLSSLRQASNGAVSIAEIESACGRGGVADGRGPRGRDVLAWVGIGLRRRYASLNAQACEGSQLENQLRASAGFFLERSEWLRNLREEMRLAADEVCGG